MFHNDPKMLKRMGVHIPGITNKKERKRLTESDKIRIREKVLRWQNAEFRASQLTEDDINLMMDRIVGGYRNWQMYYSQYGQKKPYSVFVRLFSTFLRELEGYY